MGGIKTPCNRTPPKIYFNTLEKWGESKRERIRPNIHGDFNTLEKWGESKHEDPTKVDNSHFNTLEKWGESKLTA